MPLLASSQVTHGFKSIHSGSPVVNRKLMIDGLMTILSEALDSIASSQGLPKNPYVLESRTLGVLFMTSAIEEGEKKIFFNPDNCWYLTENMSSDNWGAFFVLAHEVGHFFNNDVKSNYTTSKADELEADFYAGYLLYFLGCCDYRISEIGSEIFIDDEDFPASERIDKIYEGYNKAQAKYPNLGTCSEDSEPEPNADPEFDPEPESDPVESPVLLPNGTIDTVWTQFGFKIGSVDYIRIHCIELEDKNNNYKTFNGKVAFSKDFTAPYDNTRYDDFYLDFPSTELDLGDGMYEGLYYYLKIYDNDSRQLFTSEKQFFNWTSDINKYPLPK
ncbi:unnamed protein product [Rotaria sordida]|uniref:Uncharacterized protein n=1 Tax=Rotaria sordida TaxID=392033 RepID=A0A814FN22_9BILA|nr:unnamed protein product [Rotaria sordida]